MRRFLDLSLVLISVCLLLLGLRGAAVSGEFENYRIPILVYHRFNETVVDSMTVTTERFESQIRYLRDHDHKFVPLRTLVEARLKRSPLPENTVVFTADDGHRSVYNRLFRLARKYQLPVTLFIYPSAISNADYAMTWQQLAELKNSGLFEVQSHTFWHPNFLREKRRLSPTEYDKFASTQLAQSKKILESKLGGTVDLLAWPFGIYDDDLIGKAEQAGYLAGFTIEGRHVTPRDHMMTLPRYLMTQVIDMRMFAELMSAKR